MEINFEELRATTSTEFVDAIQEDLNQKDEFDVYDIAELLDQSGENHTSVKIYLKHRYNGNVIIHSFFQLIGLRSNIDREIILFSDFAVLEKIHRG